MTDQTPSTHATCADCGRSLAPDEDVTCDACGYWDEETR